MADVVTDRLVQAIDPSPMYINSVASSTLPPARIPMHFATDRLCLETLMPTVGKFDMKEVRIGWIHNTLELTPIVLSENLRAEIEGNPLLEILEGPMELAFDAAGDLEPVLSAQTVGTRLNVELKELYAVKPGETANAGQVVAKAPAPLAYRP